MNATNNTPKPKFKKCKTCGAKFEVFRSTQLVCSMPCALALGKINHAKKEKKAHAQAKRNLTDNDRSFQLKKTQQIFNKYIRLRDSNEPCISCGRFHQGQYHAGHYRTVGASPELRFDERNCHKQCSPCNNHLSGNIVNYRIRLLHVLGSEVLGELEGPHEPKKYTIDELKELQVKYKSKTKELESNAIN